MSLKVLSNPVEVECEDPERNVWTCQTLPKIRKERNTHLSL